MAAHQIGDLTTAEPLYRQVVELEPQQADALHYLGLILQQRGESAQAIELLKRALDARANNPECWSNLGNMLSEANRRLEAIDAYTQALRLRPSHVNTHYNLGLVLFDVGDFKAAVASIRRAINLSPDDAQMWNSLGEALTRAQSFDEAFDAFHTSYRLAPDFAEACNNLGLAYLDRGESQAANKLFREGLRLDPKLPEAWANLVRSRRYTAADKGELDAMLGLLEKGSLDARGCTLMHFSLGKAYDDCGDYDRAFTHYATGNDLKARECHFDLERHRDLVTRTIEVFDFDLFQQLRGLGANTEEPIFIIGMPRSGSSLVEQIVASHPQAAGVGEFSYMTELCHRLSEELASNVAYPECVGAIDVSTARRLSEGYVTALTERSAGAKRVADKMLSNFLYLGVIAVLFPNAKIIHCRRDARDISLSNYFQLFGAGQFYSYRLDGIASYYQEYSRLMKHWRKVLPIEIHEVVYEDLVQEQEEISRKLIQYCSLPWDDACLTYYQTHRSVHTASNWQVRQKVYKSSSARWKKYAQYLPESVLSLD